MFLCHPEENVRFNSVYITHLDYIIEEDCNTTYDKDLNTCDEDSNTCDEDLNTTCDEDLNTACDEVHINNTKHITIANIYIPPRDTTSTHYKTADTDIQHCIQYITNIPLSATRTLMTTEDN